PAPAQFRANRAAGRGYHFRLGSHLRLPSGEWRLGIDGETAEHTAVITNPNAAAFRIVNFNAAERDVLGLYAQWNRPVGRLDLEAGLRLNRVETASGPVSASIPAMNPMMAMMAANAEQLADTFNARDARRTRSN